MKKSTVKFIESEQRSKCFMSSAASLIACASIVGLISTCNDSSAKPSEIVFMTLITVVLCFVTIAMIMCKMDTGNGFKDGISDD